MITVKRKVQFAREARGQRRVNKAVEEPRPVQAGRIHRISRLMALAIRMERMLQAAEVTDITELARLGHVTQPRMSQILNLTLLAPDIQEELLFLPRIMSGKAAIHEKVLRPITGEMNWEVQREMWATLKNMIIMSSREVTTEDSL